MKVFKFGGASVSDAKSIINLSDILKRYNDDIVVVISAIGKTTREIEQIVKAYFYNEDYHENLELLLNKHRTLINELFDNNKSRLYTDF